MIMPRIFFFQTDLVTYGRVKRLWTKIYISWFLDQEDRQQTDIALKKFVYRFMKTEGSFPLHWELTSITFLLNIGALCFYSLELMVSKQLPHHFVTIWLKKQSIMQKWAAIKGHQVVNIAYIILMLYTY